jgi:hypothetical protein
MLHYVIQVMGQDLKELHDCASQEAGITGTILHHGQLEVFTYLATIYPETLIQRLMQSQVEWTFAQVKG